MNDPRIPFVPGGYVAAFDLTLPATGSEPGVRHTSPGMSLRDYFAGQALAGCLASAECQQTLVDAVSEHKLSELVANIAQFTYVQADAMLTARTVVPRDTGEQT